MRRKSSPANEVPRPWLYTVVVGGESMVGHRDQNGTAIQKGRATVTRETVMATFDNLPKDVRAALANAAHDWAPHWAWLAKEDWPSTALIERISQADREMALRREAQLIAGDG